MVNWCVTLMPLQELRVDGAGYDTTVKLQFCASCS
jgi:hypothetical protein